ncbi:MAG: hypothetical protein KBF21_13220 [Thermoanaerobaculia bacterium]|nr:hypothetical protein [Thermoanaerobaculia bacterium]
MRPLGLPAVCACLLAAPLLAADGDLDPTLSADGRATVLWQESGTTQAEASAVAALADGSLVVGGTMIWTPPAAPFTFDWVLAKLTRTGILDTSWGESGRKRIAFDLVEGGGDVLYGVFADPDGSIFAIGSTYDGATQVPAVVRLLPSGDGDPAFGDVGHLYLGTPWTDPQLQFVAAERQLDGRLLLAGHCLRCPSNTTHYNPFVLRLLENGSPDASWSFDGWAVVSDGGTTNDSLTAFAPDSQGRIVIAFNADDNVRLARLNAMGGLDSAFGGDGFVDLVTELGLYDITALAIDPATRKIHVVFSGTFSTLELAYVMRISTFGTEDGSYGVEGIASFILEEGIELEDALLQGDGKLIVAGKMNATGAQAGGFFLARLDGEGLPDASFDGNGVARYEFDRATNGDDHALALTLSGGKPVGAGFAVDGNDERDMALLRIQNSYIFADGFEAGHTLLWSASTL